MRVGPGSPIVLAGSVSGASLRVTEAGKKGNGVLQLQATAAGMPAHTQASASGSRTNRELNRLGSFMCNKKHQGQAKVLDELYKYMCCVFSQAQQPRS